MTYVHHGFANSSAEHIPTPYSSIQARTIVQNVRDRHITPHDGFRQLTVLIQNDRTSEDGRNSLIAFLCSYVSRNPAVLHDDNCVEQARRLVGTLHSVGESTIRALCQAASLLKDKSPQLTIQILDKVTALYPHCEYAFGIRADFHLSRGEYGKAMSDVDRLLEINTQSTIGLNTKGRIYFAQKLFEAAHQCFDACLNRNRFDEYSLTLKGQAYLAQGLFHNAHQCLDIALERNPKNCIALSLKAEIFLAENKFAEAHRCLDEGMLINPRDVIVFNTRGRVFFLQKDFESAERSFLITLGIRRNDKTALDWLNRIDRIRRQPACRIH